MQRLGRNKLSRQTIEQPLGRVLVPHQARHTTVSLRYFADTETSTRWEKLTAVDPRRVGTTRLVVLSATYLTANQSEDCPEADHTLFESLL